MRESPQPPVSRCDVAGGYECPGPGLPCGIPCEGNPGPVATGRGEPPRGPIALRVDWYCRACALEIPGRYIWDLRAHRLCPACGSSLSLLEIGGDSLPIRRCPLAEPS